MTYVFGNVANWFSNVGKDATVEESNNEQEVGQNDEKNDQENITTSENENKTNDNEQNQSLEKDLKEVSHLAMNAAKDLGGYIFNLGKTYTIQVAKTAKHLKETIEENTIIGDFTKEQEKFLNVSREKKKMADAAVPPWVGYNEEELMKTQIMDLSKDKRNVLRNPPSGIQFHFDFENSFPIALVMLEEDERLKALRFELVPKQIKEEIFWRNYFYRVSLIKQSTQLTSLTHQQDLPKDKVSIKDEALHEDHHLDAGDDKEHTKVEDSEFVSDAFIPTNVQDPDLTSAMQQLSTNSPIAAEVSDWEQELQAELQEYEVVSDEISDAALEQEILSQLEEEVRQKAN